jgi:hypothetical protein
MEMFDSRDLDHRHFGYKTAIESSQSYPALIMAEAIADAWGRLLGLLRGHKNFYKNSGSLPGTGPDPMTHAS